MNEAMLNNLTLDELMRHMELEDQPPAAARLLELVRQEIPDREQLEDKIVDLEDEIAEKDEEIDNLEQTIAGLREELGEAA